MTLRLQRSRPSWLGWLGHGLTAARLVASAWIFQWIVDGRFLLAAGAMLLAMASDLLDGPLVRRFGRPSTAGAWFDIGADLALVVGAFAGFGAAGVLPWWPLWAIGFSFAAFAATARRRLYDPFGRSIGGVLMLAATGVLLGSDLLVQLALGWAAVSACALTMLVRLASAMRVPAVGARD